MKHGVGSMRPEILHTIQVRDIGAALPTLDQVDMVQHHVSRTEMRRYLALTDQQWWALVDFLKTMAPIAHSN